MKVNENENVNDDNRDKIEHYVDNEVKDVECFSSSNAEASVKEAVNNIVDLENTTDYYVVNNGEVLVREADIKINDAEINK